MNNDPNSDCEQCIGSKLGWVHNVHTQNPRLRAHYTQATRTPRVGRRVVDHLAPCRGPPPAVSRVSQRFYAMSQGTGCHVVARVATQRLSLRHDTKLCIATLLVAWPRARALPLARRADRLCRARCCHVPAPCCAPLRAPACLCPAMSRYSLLYCDPAPKMGSSSSSCLLHIFFSSYLFFHLFYSLQDHKKYFFFSYLQ